jgi:hypothetical protein
LCALVALNVSTSNDVIGGSAVLTCAIGAALRHVYAALALADELEADSN